MRHTLLVTLVDQELRGSGASVPSVHSALFHMGHEPFVTSVQQENLTTRLAVTHVRLAMTVSCPTTTALTVYHVLLAKRVPWAFASSAQMARHQMRQEPLVCSVLWALLVKVEFVLLVHQLPSRHLPVNQGATFVSTERPLTTFGTNACVAPDLPLAVRALVALIASQ